MKSFTGTGTVTVEYSGAQDLTSAATTVVALLEGAVDLEVGVISTPESSFSLKMRKATEQASRIILRNYLIVLNFTHFFFFQHIQKFLLS
jgi:hypothetical protein